jgi:hypothetical protein
MVVTDLNVKGIAVNEAETDPPSIVAAIPGTVRCNCNSWRIAQH